MRKLVLTLILVLGLAAPAGAAVTYISFGENSFHDLGVVGDGLVYASSNDACRAFILFKSLDNGATWNRITELTATGNVAAADGVIKMHFGSDRIWYTSFIQTNPYALGGGELAVSLDEGATWQSMNDYLDPLFATASRPRDAFTQARGCRFASYGSMGNTYARNCGTDLTVWSPNATDLMFDRLLGDANVLLLAGKTEMAGMWYLRWYDPETMSFLPLDGVLPTDFFLSGWRTYTKTDQATSLVTLLDNESGDSGQGTAAQYVLVTSDGATVSRITIPAGVTVTDALAISANMVFVSGTTIVDGAAHYVVQMTFNGGRSWTPLADEVSDHVISLTSDSAGKVYALRKTPDGLDSVGGYVGLYTLSMD